MLVMILPQTLTFYMRISFEYLHLTWSLSSLNVKLSFLFVTICFSIMYIRKNV